MEEVAIERGEGGGMVGGVVGGGVEGFWDGGGVERRGRGGVGVLVGSVDLVGGMEIDERWLVFWI